MLMVRQERLRRDRPRGPHGLCPKVTTVNAANCDGELPTLFVWLKAFLQDLVIRPSVTRPCVRRTPVAFPRPSSLQVPEGPL